MKSVIFSSALLLLVGLSKAANPYLVCKSDDYSCKQEQSSKCQQAANECWQRPYSESVQQECNAINSQCSEIWSYTGNPVQVVTSTTAAKTLPNLLLLLLRLFQSLQLLLLRLFQNLQL
ncbi:hypothetical protein U3516DRAFT_245283 [Neocallimastix sp. 'constans']